VGKAYALWRAFQDKVVSPVAALLLLGCTLLAIAEIFRRYVLGLSFYWAQDAVIYLILSGVFFYFSISQRHNEHLNVTLFVQLLEGRGPRARRVGEIVEVVGSAFGFVFLLLVVWWGVPEALDSQKYNTRTESLILPLWPFLYVLLVGFLFMAISLFFQVYSGIQKLRGRKGLEEPAQEGAGLH